MPVQVDKVRTMPYTIEHDDGTKTVYDLGNPQEAKAFANVMRSVVDDLNMEVVKLRAFNAQLQVDLEQKGNWWRAAALSFGLVIVLIILRFTLFE